MANETRLEVKLCKTVPLDQKIPLAGYSRNDRTKYIRTVAPATIQADFYLLILRSLSWRFFD